MQGRRAPRRTRRGKPLVFIVSKKGCRLAEAAGVPQAPPPLRTFEKSPPPSHGAPWGEGSRGLEKNLLAGPWPAAGLGIPPPCVPSALGKAPVAFFFQRIVGKAGLGVHKRDPVVSNPNSQGTSRGSRRRPRPARSGGRGANDRFVGRRGQEGASTTHTDHPPVP